MVYFKSIQELKTKNLKKSFIVSVIIIPLILGLFFYYGYHESLFGKNPDIKISIATIIRTPVLEKPFNLSNNEDKGRIVKYLYENNWMPLTAWKTNNIYKRFDKWFFSF